MTELSPAAEAVLDAALPHAVHRYSVAAALRAAADQGEIFFDAYDSPVQVVTVEDLLAIAKELEAQ
jgi:hypothetical protein